MQYVIDSSVVINLSNVDALSVLHALPDRKFWVTQAVVDECWPTCGDDLATEIATRRLSVVDDTHIDASNFLDLLDTHSLGRGETEAIVACDQLGFALCCDDKRARALGRKVLGACRVSGTIAILRWCINDTIVTAQTAYAMYQQMRKKGGFLPDVARTSFCRSRQSHRDGDRGTH